MNTDKIVDISKAGSVHEAALKAKAALETGGIIIYPTDTSYGIGVNALDSTAVLKVYELKRRMRSKPMHIVVKNLEDAKNYAEVTETAQILAGAFLPGPLTLVLNKRHVVPFVTTAGLNTVGIRIPNNPFTMELMNLITFPITATSANVSELGDAYSVEEIKTQYGEEIEKVGLIVDAGPLPRQKPSTLVDLTGLDWKILREGPISALQIEKVLNSSDKDGEADSNESSKNEEGESVESPEVEEIK
jgi:L-threonylcarbamoyladenylate synthase